MRIASAIPLALITLSSVGDSQSTELLNMGPLARVDQISVEAMWGDSLGLPPDRGTPLFNTDLKRAGDVKSTLMTAVGKHLRQGGLQVVEKSDNVLRVGLFGGKFERSGSASKNFFMVQVEVCLADEERCTQERTVLGVIDDDALSGALVDAAVSVVDEFIGQRTAWRRAHH